MSAVAEAVEAPKIAVIYSRISKDPGHDALGVKRQESDLTAYAHERGWVLERVYRDNDVSASKRTVRPEYERLLSDVALGGIDWVLVTEVTRLARRMTDLVRVVDVVKDAGTKIHALRAGEIDLSTSGGQLQAHIMGAVAQHEVSQMSERIKAKKSEITRSGGWVGGPRPFGYDAVNGGLKLNRGEAKLVRGWVAEILAGRTTTSIARELNETGVPTTRGGSWSTVTINQIIQSPRIIGMTASGGEPIVSAHWEPIIDRATWEAVNAVLASRRRGPAAKKSLLSGLVVCGRCGNKMYGQSGGTRRPRMYACQTSSVPGRTGCGRITIASSRLDGMVVAGILDTLAETPLGKHRADRESKDSQRLVAEIAEDEAMLQDLADDWGAKRLSRREWLAARAPIDARLRENQTALRALGHGQAAVPGDLVVTAETWDGLPLEKQQAVARLLIDSITVKPIGQSGGRGFRPERVQIEWKA
jgi:DNA invertase Pin-like site-specific DNA recombinase